jgi:hypothetical protein
MEIFLIKSGYHNEYHVENLASIFLIFSPTCGQVEILVAIWLHDASKKIAGAMHCSDGQALLDTSTHPPQVKLWFAADSFTHEA